MARNLLPKYKCEAIAREANRLLRVNPAISWQQVRAFAEPRLPGLEDPVTVRYAPELRPLIANTLMREIRHQHVWSR